MYNSDEGTLSGETINVPHNAIVIVEGVWSLQEAFVNYYDFRIWLEASSETQLERGLLRDGEDKRQTWEKEWIPIDEYYRNTLEPQLRTDIIVDSVNSKFENDKIVLI